VWPVLEYACPACHSSLMAAQSKALEAIQRRAIGIIFVDSDYEMALMLAGLDPLEARRARLTERFFRPSVLCEESCLNYLLPDKRDSSVTGRLHHTKTFKPLPAGTDKFRNSFIPCSLEHFDQANYYYFSCLDYIVCVHTISYHSECHCTNPATGCYEINHLSYWQH